ncbi:hypothetical protein D3C87_324410 [compost metagenome]
MKRKNNSHLMTILAYSPGIYRITIWNKDKKDGVNFEYKTALGTSEVQQIFFDLTDYQVEEILLREKK